MQVVVNLDVPDLAAAEMLYTAASDLHAGPRLGQHAVERLGAPVAIQLLAKHAAGNGAPARIAITAGTGCPASLT